MGKTLFSLKNLLVLSLAVNVSLVLRVVIESDRQSFRRGVPMAEGSEKGGSRALSETQRKASEVEDDGHRIVNLDHGDPTMYESYWQERGEETTLVIRGWDSMSYFSNFESICWFLEPEFAKQVLRLHEVVGNAVTEGRHIVVGTGSSQLYLAALYALSDDTATEPTSVVSQAPYYSSYPLMTDYQKSGLHKWAGDSRSFTGPGPYIELVTSPNNPDGLLRYPVVNLSGGSLIHDLAYFWPQYTPITAPSDNALSLFTTSKCTGHAGMRIGWALVKDAEVARRMTKFVELNTIGVSKDSQLRAAKMLRAVTDSCARETEGFFEKSHRVMAERWDRLRHVIKSSGFSLPEFSPAYCRFHGRETVPQPGFAWLQCPEGVDDCASFLRGHNILTRGGRHFGGSDRHVRVSMLDRHETFTLFLKRLSAIR